jgi:hypothetical protein
MWVLQLEVLQLHWEFAKCVCGAWAFLTGRVGHGPRDLNTQYICK